MKDIIANSKNTVTTNTTNKNVAGFPCASPKGVRYALEGFAYAEEDKRNIVMNQIINKRKRIVWEKSSNENSVESGILTPTFFTLAHGDYI
jgi:TolB-like protein